MRRAMLLAGVLRSARALAPVIRRQRPLTVARHMPTTQEEIEASGKFTFPNLHINVLFQAGGGAALIVAEIQIHHEAVLAVSKQDHKLYEVIRADSIAALAGATAISVIGGPTEVEDVAAISVWADPGGVDLLGEASAGDNDDAALTDVYVSGTVAYVHVQSDVRRSESYGNQYVLGAEMYPVPLHQRMSQQNSGYNPSHFAQH